MNSLAIKNDNLLGRAPSTALLGGAGNPDSQHMTLGTGGDSASVPQVWDSCVSTCCVTVARAERDNPAHHSNVLPVMLGA